MGARGCFVAVATTMLAFFIAPPAPAQTAHREVIVHLNATPDVTLEREDDGDWTEVCFAPCDMPFSARKRYRVGGGIRDSDPFWLRQTQPGLAIVDVDSRSRGLHAFGDVLIGVGSALTFGGLLAAGMGAATANCSSGPTRDSCGAGHLVAPGLGVAALGVVAIVVGVDLAIVNNASRVYREPKAEASRDARNRSQAMLFDLSQRQEDAWAAPSTTVAAPIFTYRF